MTFTRLLIPVFGALLRRATPWMAALTFCAPALAQYPARPVRMMIPFPAGGPSDFVGRLIAQHLTDLWGKQIVVDNRAGASGIIGTEIAVRSNPDGYTLLFGTNSTFAVNLVLIKNLPYDVFRDLALIGLWRRPRTSWRCAKGCPRRT